MSHTIQTVFLIGVPIAAAAFLLSWLLPEVPLRKSIRTTDPGEGVAVPEGRTSLQEIELALERVATRENRAELYRTLAERAGLDLPPRACWLLYRLADRPDCTLEGWPRGSRCGRPDRAGGRRAGRGRHGDPLATVPTDCDLRLTAAGRRGDRAA